MYIRFVSTHGEYHKPNYTLIPHHAMPKNPHTEDTVPKSFLESITIYIYNYFNVPQIWVPVSDFFCQQWLTSLFFQAKYPSHGPHDPRKL